MADANERYLFGTDGVRGLANSELTPDLAFNLARAAADPIAPAKPIVPAKRLVEGHVLIGRDTRRSGPMLVSALEAGFNSIGIDTVDAGIIPVGAVSRLARDTGAAYGVMVSASHNPAADNGIKFFGSDGAKLSDADELAIERRYYAKDEYPRPIGSSVGLQTQMDDAIDRYVDMVARTVRYSMHGLEFIVDCANGAAFAAAPALFDRVGASIEVINDQPDGMNINSGVGATHPEHLAELSKGRIGFAFDGDADRLIAVDEDGDIVNGDVIMAIFAQWQLERKKLKNDTVVVTVMSNLGFHKAMERLGITVIETSVGDRYVLEAMRKSRAIVGGEQSGHVLLEDRATGDGLRTALRLMEVVASTGKQLRELRRVMKTFPQVLRNVTVLDKAALDTNEAISLAVRSQEETLQGRGRVLVRPSGTEPVVRVMVEADTEDEARDVAGRIADVVAAELG